jgi:hypothetical protein
MYVLCSSYIHTSIYSLISADCKAKPAIDKKGQKIDNRDKKDSTKLNLITVRYYQNNKDKFD